MEQIILDGGGSQVILMDEDSLFNTKSALAGNGYDSGESENSSSSVISGGIVTVTVDENVENTVSPVSAGAAVGAAPATESHTILYISSGQSAFQRFYPQQATSPSLPYVWHQASLVVKGGRTLGPEIITFSHAPATGIYYRPEVFGSYFESQNYSEIYVVSGGTLGGLQKVQNNSTYAYHDDMVTFNSNGTSYFLGGALVKSGGIVHVSGTAIGDSLYDSGTIYVLSDGLLDCTYMNGGNLVVSNGGVASRTRYNTSDTIYTPNNGSVSEIAPATITVMAGGIIRDTYFDSPANNGGNSDSLVDHWGTSSYKVIELAYGGAASNTRLGLLGYMYVAGYAYNTIISGGSQIVSGGGVTSITTISSGGALIQNGGSARSIDLNTSGTMTCENGATLSGVISITAEAVLTINGTVSADAATITLDVVSHDTSSEVFIENINNISSASFRVFVDNTVVNGNYALGTGSFSGTMELYFSGDTASSGTISVGTSVITSNKREYTLTETDGTLYLTVTSARTYNGTPSDINDNGISDIILQATNGTIGAWLDGTDTWSICGFASGWNVIAVDDFNGNNHADILLQNGNSVGYWESGESVKWVGLPGLANGWQISAIGDFDGNGKADILMYNSAYQTLGIRYDGGVGEWRTVSTGVDLSGQAGFGINSSWEIVGTGDFDGDGLSDILLRDTVSGVVGSWLDGYSSNWKTIGGGADLASGWTIAGTGDFDGNGLSDIILTNANYNLVGVWMNGSSTWKTISTGTSLTEWQVVGAGDYNGNNKDDILFRNNDSGLVIACIDGDSSKWETIGDGVPADHWTILA